MAGATVPERSEEGGVPRTAPSRPAARIRVDPGRTRRADHRHSESHGPRDRPEHPAPRKELPGGLGERAIARMEADSPDERRPLPRHWRWVTPWQRAGPLGETDSRRLRRRSANGAAVSQGGRPPYGQGSARSAMTYPHRDRQSVTDQETCPPGKRPGRGGARRA